VKRGLGAAAVVAALAACAPHADRSAEQPARPPGLQAWRQARAELRALQARYRPAEPYSMNVALELTQQQLGKRMRARGAVAVHPPAALRMILIGPGGTTALDLWICDDAFRLEVPAIDLRRRGDASTPATQLRGLPVEFLRWWFLRPLSGRLLSFIDRDAERRFVLNDGGKVVHLTAAAAADRRLTSPLHVQRLSLDDRETLRIDGKRCGRVRYQQQSTAIDIEVECEQLNPEAPPARAFADPDDPTRGCQPAQRGPR